MSTISANIFVAKKTYQCVDCHHYILPGEKYMRLYGFAETGDPMDTHHFHLKCLIGMRPDSKMLGAFFKKHIPFKMDIYGHLLDITITKTLE